MVIILKWNYFGFWFGVVCSQEKLTYSIVLSIIGTVTGLEDVERT